MPRRFNMQNFIKDVLNDKYALVIGNESILDISVEPTGDVHNFFLRKVNETSREQYETYHDIALDKSERINPIRQLVKSGDIIFDSKSVSRELMTLLETKIFTTVLTTTTDGFLEAAMKAVWGKDLRIVNIYDKDTVDELQKARRVCRKGRTYNQPTLIYVFGKMDGEDLTKRYIRTEADAILLIEKWMRMDIESNNELLDFIRSKRLLSLGCKYDNWYFRFFWYVLTGNIDSEKYEGTGEVAFVLNSEEQSDKLLQKFLERTNICILGETKSFINSIVRMLTEESDNAPFRQQVINYRHNGGIFISYCNKDSLLASQLFFQLCDKKYDVWIDSSRLYGGDDYETNISNAISSSKVFIALLSPAIAEDLKQGYTEHFYNKEWRMAQQLNNKVIIPVAINGYDLRSEYHRLFDNIIGYSYTGVDLMDQDGFHKLTSAINEHF